MCEFTGLDFEMEIKQHYHEVLAVLGDLLVFIFDQVNANCQAELATVAQQFPFKPLRYNKETLILPFPNAVSMLQQSGEEIGPEDDFTSEAQRSTTQHSKTRTVNTTQPTRHTQTYNATCTSVLMLTDRSSAPHRIAALHTILLTLRVRLVSHRAVLCRVAASVVFCLHLSVAALRRRSDWVGWWLRSTAWTSTSWISTR